MAFMHTTADDMLSEVLRRDLSGEGCGKWLKTAEDEKQIGQRHVWLIDGAADDADRQTRVTAWKAICGRTVSAIKYLLEVSELIEDDETLKAKLPTEGRVIAVMSPDTMPMLKWTGELPPEIVIEDMVITKNTVNGIRTEFALPKSVVLFLWDHEDAATMLIGDNLQVGQEDGKSCIVDSVAFTGRGVYRVYGE